MKITNDTLIALITEKYPEIGEVLMEDYGFHCVGCMASEMETFEQGAQVHGYGAKEIKEMLKTLNQLVEDIEANKKSEK